MAKLIVVTSTGPQGTLISYITLAFGQTILPGIHDGPWINEHTQTGVPSLNLLEKEGPSFFPLGWMSHKRSSHVQSGCPNIAITEKIPVDAEGVVQKLNRKWDNLSKIVPLMTFFSAVLTVHVAYSANLLDLG